MEARYRRELNAGYLILDAPENPDDYEIRILTENRIPGILPMAVNRIDDRIEYDYEVSGYRPLKKALEKCQLDSAEIQSLLRGIGRAVDSLEEYLLPVEEVLLEPEFLYVTQDLSRVSFCCCPGYKADFYEGLRDLTRYFLNKVDHTEEQSVEIAYELFRVSSQDVFTFEELLQVPEKFREASAELSDVTISANSEIIWSPEEEEGVLPVIPEPRKKRRRFWFFPFPRRKERAAPSPDSAPQKTGLRNAGETKLLRGEGEVALETHLLISQNSLQYETIPLTNLPFVIGKTAEACDGLIASPVISRIHARIEQSEEGLCLIDCRSTNGTFRNGMRLTPGQPCLLHAGDEVAFANIRYIFQ